MTNLNIIPNFEKKTAKFTGTIAAGEKIHVSISNIGGYIVGVENLRLRAVGSDGGTLATFPPFGDESLNWVKDGDTIECDLNLNTVQMLESVPPASRVMVLFVLDNPEDEILYFKSFFAVDHWPRRVGEDEPVDLGGYSDFVAEAKNSIKEAESAIDAASKNAMNASRNAVEAAKNAEEAVEVAKKIVEGFDAKAEKTDVEVLDNRVTKLEQNGGGSSVEVVAPDADAQEGQAADAKAVHDKIKALTDNVSDLEAADINFEDALHEKVDKIVNAPNGVVYPNEVSLEAGGFYLIGLNESNVCNAYLPTAVASFDPQTFIVYCRNGASTRFIDQLGRTILSNLNGTSYTGGSVNLRLMGFPTQRFVAVTMRIIKDDAGSEIIHLEVV